ncbi:MAG: redoxin domain-containing protein, partial [Gammaproteobacteria bacterium]
MKFFKHLVLLTWFSAGAQLALAAPERVANFALLDHQGMSQQLRRYGDSKAVVLISVATDCQATVDQLPKFQLLRTTWENQGIAFLALAASANDSLVDLQRFDQLYHLGIPILDDDSQLVAENLGIRKSGELLIVEPDRFRVLYRGGLDAAPVRAQAALNIEASDGTTVLADTLAAIADDRGSRLNDVAQQEVSGCELDFPARQRHAMEAPDYATEIAPLLQEKCVACHIDGGIAPFAMDSHMMVQGWSPMMKEVLLTKRMPPAQVDPSIRHFTNARYMEPEQVQTLVHWIDAGSPRGESEVDPLALVEPPHSEWELGEPDYVVDVPAYTVPATGVLDYENVTINLPFEEDVWVKSVQHLPGDRRVLHHLLSFIVPADYDEKIIEGENDSYREFLEGYAPGKDGSATYPADSGVFVPKGSAVQMSLHYTTFGKESVDNTRLGLYFAKEEPKYQYSTYSLSHGGSNLNIPPGVSEHKMTASYVFEDEIMLHGLRPHMHYRGKYMRMSVIYPDGNREDILNVPDYNFAWQPTYRLSD